MARTFSTCWLLACGLFTVGLGPYAYSRERSADLLATLQGSWLVQACRQDGRAFPPLQGARVQFHEQDMILILPNELIKARVAAETVDDQATLTFEYLLGSDRGHTRRAVCAFRGERIYLCLGPLDGPCPTDLTCRRGSRRLLLVLQREQSGQQQAR